MEVVAESREVSESDRRAADRDVREAEGSDQRLTDVPRARGCRAQLSIFWSATYEIDGDDSCNQVSPLDDGSFAICGHSSLESGQATLTKVSANGDEARFPAPAADGLIVAAHGYFGAVTTDLRLIRLGNEPSLAEVDIDPRTEPPPRRPGRRWSG